MPDLLPEASSPARDFAVASVREQSMRVELLRTDVRELEGRLEEFRLSDQELAGRLKTSEGKLREKDQGIAPLAARVLKSVFTVKTDEGLGAGFAGWTTSLMRTESSAVTATMPGVEPAPARLATAASPGVWLDPE